MRSITLGKSKCIYASRDHMHKTSKQDRGRKSLLLRFLKKLNELKNLSNWGFLAQFFKKLCAYEPHLHLCICMFFSPPLSTFLTSQNDALQKNIDDDVEGCQTHNFTTNIIFPSQTFHHLPFLFLLPPIFHCSCTQQSDIHHIYQ